MRKCAICEVSKDESEFYRSSRVRRSGEPYISSYCKSCAKSRSKLAYHTRCLPGAKPTGWDNMTLPPIKMTRELYDRIARGPNLDINDWSELLQFIGQFVDFETSEAHDSTVPTGAGPIPEDVSVFKPEPTTLSRDETDREIQDLLNS